MLEEEVEDEEEEDEKDGEDGPSSFNEKADLTSLSEKLSVLGISPSSDVVAGKLHGTESLPTDSPSMEYPT